MRWRFCTDFHNSADLSTALSVGFRTTLCSVHSQRSLRYGVTVWFGALALHFRYESHFTFLTADGHALKDQVTALGLDINELPQVRLLAQWHPLARDSRRVRRRQSPIVQSHFTFTAPSLIRYFSGNRNCGEENPVEFGIVGLAGRNR